MPPDPSLFRKEALQRLLSPEPLDRLMRITSPASWLALAGIGALLLFVIAWSIFGVVPKRVAGQGLLIREGGVDTVYSSVAGRISALHVAVGDAVEANQTIAEVLDIDSGESKSIVSSSRGTVLELAAKTGSLVKPETPLLTMIDESRELQAVVYAPMTSGKTIKPGMPVLISSAAAPREEYGSLRGAVKSVSVFPTSTQAMISLLGSDALANSIIAGIEGVPVEIVIGLQADPTTVSGYSWTSPGGAPFVLESGTPIDALITVNEQRPISLVLPGIE